MSIRDIIQSFLKDIGVPYRRSDYDHAFAEKCSSVAISRGYHMDGPNSLQRYLPGGVIFASIGYAHLKDEDVRVYICIYIALLFHLDDAFQSDTTDSRVFSERFIRNEPQNDLLLDNLAEHLKSAYEHLSAIAGGMVVAATLNFATSLTMDFETQGMKIHPLATGFPPYSRALSGAAEAIGMFVFPRELPTRTFIQALPDLMTFLNNTNDVLSFYKEESDGEDRNQVSLLSSCLGTSKHDVVKDLARGSLVAHERICKILGSVDGGVLDINGNGGPAVGGSSPHPTALESYLAFRKAYIEVHLNMKRYRMDELDLAEGS